MKAIVFTRKTCPSCPTVKRYMEALDIEKEFIDVDAYDSAEKLTQYSVMSAPTVIFLEGDKEIGRARTVEEIKVVIK